MPRTTATSPQKSWTPSGITVDIDRNTEFPNQRSRSRDISKLRVEITYLSGRSLRWKVCFSKFRIKTKTMTEYTI